MASGASAGAKLLCQCDQGTLRDWGFAAGGLYSHCGHDVETCEVPVIITESIVQTGSLNSK